MSNKEFDVDTGDVGRVAHESTPTGESGNAFLKSNSAMAIAVAGLLIITCAAPSRVPAKDLGMIYGEPQPALAMWIAQVHFAVSQCIADNKVGDKGGAQKLLKYFDNASQFRVYAAKDPDFNPNYERFLGAYAEGWKQANPKQRD